MNSHMNTPKCDYCGRFIADTDLHTEFTPDTPFSEELVEHYHKACWDVLSFADYLHEEAFS